MQTGQTSIAGKYQVIALTPLYPTGVYMVLINQNYTNTPWIMSKERGNISSSKKKIGFELINQKY